MFFLVFFVLHFILFKVMKMFLMVKTLISVYKIMDGREILKGLFTQN